MERGGRIKLLEKGIDKKKGNDNECSRHSLKLLNGNYIINTLKIKIFDFFYKMISLYEIFNECHETLVNQIHTKKKKDFN